MLFRLLLPVCWLLLISPVLAQTSKRADLEFARMAYAPAAQLYEQALTEKPALAADALRRVRFRLGDCYRQLRDTQQAERTYRTLIGEGKLPADYTDAYLHFAQALASNGKYAEAQEVYETYATLRGDDSRGATFAKLYRDVSALTTNAGSYRVDFLDLNTRRAEFSPVYYQEGLVFVTQSMADNGIRRVFDWDNTPFLDLYFVPDLSTVRATAPDAPTANKRSRQVKTQAYRALGRDDFTARTANDSRTVGAFGGNQVAAGEGYDVVPVSESDQFSQSLNSKYHEGPATFSRDGTRVIFTRNNVSRGRSAVGKEGVTKLKLYTARQVNGIWQDIAEMPFNSDEFSTGHPALSRDGQRLYFASDMAGGFGGTDIYVATWAGDRWSAPVNVGPTVNSKGNELFPFVDEKGHLYVASDGLPGLGDLDIFYAEMTPDGLAAKLVRNLGEPINSAKDDFGIVTDGTRKTGYFSSNRRHGGADDDIYRFTREGSLYPCRQLTLNVFDGATNAPLPGTVVVMTDGEPGSDRKEGQTDAGGDIKLCVDADSEWTFVVTRNGYADTKVGFSTRNVRDDQPSRLDVALNPLRAKTGSVSHQGRVTDRKDNAPLPGVAVTLTNECDGSVTAMTSDENGVYSFTTALGCAYRLDARRTGMATTGTRIAADGTGSPDLLLFGEGDVMRVENIYYDLGKSKIRRDAAVELDKVVSLLNRYPGMTIELRSHTDSRSPAAYNSNLSTSRANAAAAYIRAKGIAKSRIRATGYGESELVNDCADDSPCTEAQHQQNRRTEIKILSIE